MRTVRSYAPGRVELAGNHTDHQGGRAIAAAVSCGIEVFASQNNEQRARLQSPGFAPVDIDVADGTPRPSELGTTAALVRGIASGLREMGVSVQGFDAHVESALAAGSGLSSSAAFELALACALLVLFGEDASFGPIVRPRGKAESADSNLRLKLAHLGQHAEREYFGKPCGLLDQAAIALGGVNLLDFANEGLSCEPIDCDFSACGHALCLIDTHCDHSRYTNEYAQVAHDMSDAARFFGSDVLSQVSEGEYLAGFDSLRSRLGDLVAMRGLHYFHEMRLVDVRAKALRSGDFPLFLEATRASGASSAQYLQNVSTFDRASQPAMVALALADSLLEGEGAARIHGGGFGGTVQAFVPADRLGAFSAAIDAHLGKGSCRAYDIATAGAGAQWM